MRRATILGLVISALSTGPTQAGVTCSVAAGTFTIHVIDGDRVRVFRDGSQLRATESGGFDCSTTISGLNTFRVNDTSTNGDVHVALDLSQGPFGPGQTVEPSGISEIEVEVLYDPGSLLQQLAIIGTDGRDVIHLGGSGAGGDLANLNDDDDFDDVSMSNEDLLTIRTGGGNDHIDAHEVPAFDIPYIPPLNVNGAGGHDRVKAGRGPLSFRGGPAGDLVVGGPRGDVLIGGAGNDGLRGHERMDLLRGGTGDDYLGGGLGRDRCRGGSGANRLVSCELS
jgi:Ca2+-binding RTX toxin-like protein